jgi:hypothetical protein
MKDGQIVKIDINARNAIDIEKDTYGKKLEAESEREK